MILVDTNVLLYAINKDAERHTTSRQFIEWVVNGSQPWALSWGIAYEFLRVATHPRVFRRPLSVGRAYEFLDAILLCDHCVLLTETIYHQKVMQDAIGEVHRVSGNSIHDLHHAILMREHGIKDIVTYDSDFRAFPWIVVCRPEDIAD